MWYHTDVLKFRTATKALNEPSNDLTCDVTINSGSEEFGSFRFSVNMLVGAFIHSLETRVSIR